MTINKYLRHRVDVVHVTVTSTGRAEVLEENVPAFIGHKTRVIRGPHGDNLVASTVIFFKADANVIESDEIIVDGSQRPIVAIEHPRGRSTAIKHLQVTLG